MTSMAAAEPTPQEPAQLEAAITRMINEMDELRRLMEQDQAEIERLKADSNDLKVAAQALQAETRSLLAELMTA